MTISLAILTEMTFNVMPLGVLKLSRVLVIKQLTKMTLNLMTFCIVTLSRMTIYLMMLSIVTLSIATLSIMILSITTLIITTLSIKHSA
jgi:hypothetical protein